MFEQKPLGRASRLNPKNRFEQFSIDDFKSDEIDNFYDEDVERKIPTTYLKDESKSIISKNDSPDVGFDYSFNPYRGCEHGCIYCYARPTHEFLGFSSGLDFETKIMVKLDAPHLLEKEFQKKNYVPKMMMFSGNTDCYQPLERKLKITREALKVCLRYKNPASIITKNLLVQRDVDILKEMAKEKLVSVTLSITSLDAKLCRKMEPRTASPIKRLETIELMAKNNIPTGVNIAPIIPGLNDKEIPDILKSASERGALYAGHIMLRLPYQVKDLFTDWIEREFPDRAKKIINKIKEMRDGKLNSSEFGERFSAKGEQAEAIHNLFYLSCEKYGLNKQRIGIEVKNFINSYNNQLKLFN